MTISGQEVWIGIGVASTLLALLYCWRASLEPGISRLGLTITVIGALVVLGTITAGIGYAVTTSHWTSGERCSEYGLGRERCTFEEPRYVETSRERGAVMWAGYALVFAPWLAIATTAGRRPPI